MEPATTNSVDLLLLLVILSARFARQRNIKFKLLLKHKIVSALLESQVVLLCSGINIIKLILILLKNIYQCFKFLIY